MNNQQEFIVTARKWRPLTFSSIVGQEHITRTLKNAIKTGRIHHAYLFCGPRGVGKTTTARILARAVNCLNPVDNEPCNKCINCEAVLNNRSLDIIEIDGASNNSVDDVRTLRENAKYPPSQGKYKMYIIDEVHMLSTSAFNALLKILEEPPAHLLFVFATTESHKVPATIVSRCQRFDFRRMEISDIVYQLRNIAKQEGVKIDEESLITIAKKADGSMRDSQSIFDQVVALCGKDIKYTEMAKALHLLDEEFFFNLSDAISSKDTAKAFELTQMVISQGYEIQETLSGLLEHFRNILTTIVTKNTDLINTSEDFKKRYIESARKFTKSDILRYIQIINTTEQAIKYLPQPRIRFELAIISMAEMDKAIEIKSLIEEIRQLKSGNFDFPNKFKDIEKPIDKTFEEITITNTSSKEDLKKFPISEFLQNKSDFLSKIIEEIPVLSELTNCDYEATNDELTILHTNKIVCDAFEKNKDQINEAFAKYFNFKTIKISIKQTQQDKINKEIENASSTTENFNKIEKHPVEKKIIDLFGAIEIK